MHFTLHTRLFFQNHGVTVCLPSKLLCCEDDDDACKIQWFHAVFLPYPREIIPYIISFSLFLRIPVLTFLSITVFSLLASLFCYHYMTFGLSGV